MSKTFDFPAPRPWRIEGQAIWDANGACVVSALNPANMETRKLIVEAVNADVKRLRAFINELCDCLEEEDAEAYRTLISRAKEAAQAHDATTENEAINAANEVERLRNVLRGFADEWEKYAEEENMRAPAWASCFRSFARDCRKAIGGE